MQNNDLEDVVEDEQWVKLPPLKQKSDGRSLVGAGSKKTLASNSRLNDHSRQQSMQEITAQRNQDGAANLDNDGISQLTYPNQYASSFMPKEQSRRFEEDQQRNNQNYNGIFFEQPNGPVQLSQQSSSSHGYNPQYQQQNMQNMWQRQGQPGYGMPTNYDHQYEMGPYGGRAN